MNLIRFGIIGCGVIAEAHVLSLFEIDGATPVGVFDRNRERAEAFAAKHGIRVYPS